MRFWIQPSAKTSAFSPSAAISVAAHAVLVGAAVYGTGEAAQQLKAKESERVAYLVPLDRRAASAPQREQLRFIDVGAGLATVGVPSPNGLAPGHRGDSPQIRSQFGEDEANQSPQPLVATPDSVYSILNVDETAVRAEGSAAPLYPPEQLKAGIEGSVTVTYVVDSTGTAEQGSLVVIASTHPAFVQAVRDAMPGMRFRPATVQGRSVRELVEQTFNFRIEAPPVAPADHTRATPVP